MAHPQPITKGRSDECMCMMCAKLLPFCDSIDCNLLDSMAHGILQARILEKVAMHSSRESSQPRNGTPIS